MTHPLRAGLEEALRLVRPDGYGDGSAKYALRSSADTLLARLAALPEVEPPTVTDEMVERADGWKPLMRSMMLFLHRLRCTDQPLLDYGIDDRNGIDVDTIKDLLWAADRLMPGTLAEIENSPEIVTDPSPPKGGETP